MEPPETGNHTQLALDRLLFIYERDTNLTLLA